VLHHKIKIKTKRKQKNANSANPVVPKTMVSVLVEGIQGRAHE